MYLGIYISKSINSVKSANYQFYKFLSACVTSSTTLIISSAETLFDDLTLNVMFFSWKQLPSTLNKIPYFHVNISVSKFVLHYVVGVQVVQPCTCKEYENTYTSWLLPRIGIQPLVPVVNLYKEHINLDCITHNHKPGLGWHYLCLTKIIASVFLSLAVVWLGPKLEE